MLCRNTIDSLMLHLLKKAYWLVFSEVNLATITQLIQAAIFCSDGSLPSDQEKSLREELATRRALEFAQEEVYIFRFSLAFSKVPTLNISSDAFVSSASAGLEMLAWRSEKTCEYAAVSSSQQASLLSSSGLADY